jgi:hypothetical protein
MGNAPLSDTLGASTGAIIGIETERSTTSDRCVVSVLPKSPGRIYSMPVDLGADHGRRRGIMYQPPPTEIGGFRRDTPHDGGG